MASFGYDVETLVSLVRDGGMLNKTLASICTSEGLKTNGVKAELQGRIIEKLRAYVRIQDSLGYNRLKGSILHPNKIPAPGSSLPFRSYGNSASPGANSLSRNNGAASHFGMGGGPNGLRGPGSLTYGFKSSPFYTIMEKLGDTKICDVMTQHRHSVTVHLKVANHPTLSRIPNDTSLRLMCFCASEGYGDQDIAFPHQSEIKVNGGEFKANLRGLKNKPGSTRPVDITKDLRLKIPQYSNTVELTYALTNKAGGGPSQKFYFSIFVVKVIAVTDLVKKLECGKRITKDSVLRDMQSKARDADIVATSSVLSLKCPLSTLRIDLPCRSISCRHNQCFDATSYLQLQEQGPTWLCPICNNPASFDGLAVDEYVRDILEKTSKSVDQVTVEPDGVWRFHSKPEGSSKPDNFGDDEFDLVEVTKSGDNLKVNTPLAFRAASAVSTPQSQGQPQPSFSVQAKNGSICGKRPISAVIDLTSSGDEDEPPARAPKRQFPSGYRPPPMPNGQLPY